MNTEPTLRPQGLPEHDVLTMDIADLSFDSDSPVESDRERYAGLKENKVELAEQTKKVSAVVSGIARAEKAFAETQKSVSTGSRTLTPLLVVLGFVFSLTGCGGGSTASNDGASPRAKLGTPSTRPLPPEFRVLAKHLAFEMKPSLDDFRDDKGLSEIIAEGHLAVLDLNGIQTEDADITYVANQAKAACGEAASRLQQIKAMPKPSDAGSLFAESFVHGLYGNVYYGYALGVDAAEKQKAIMAELQGLLAAADKLDAAQMMLPRIAEKYAASPSDPDGRIVVDIDESWGSYGPNDWFCIYNAGSEDIEDCTIQVHLTGGNGQSRKDVHFVRHWPANSWMYARYEPGLEFPDSPDAGKSTVANIQKADVSIWSPKYTRTLTYAYKGAEKDKDIAEWCKGLKFTGRYHPVVSEIIWDTQRGAEFTLDGVANIPKCRVDITFREEGKSKAWHWEHDSWVKGEKKTFTPPRGGLAFDPSKIDMAISFPGTSYVHEVTLTVNE
ncbi:hypothetical protein [Rosistilla oblonga]|uniref:hypothetical protein n=1 Tax=Rosistilla oblonga TaxID=2527990 RepID=UPI003A978635